MTDADGEIFQHLEYFPFGETWVEESSNTQRTPYLFTGKELDEETELYYFGARYYDPRTSVWQSPDPILASYMGGKPNGGVHAPVNLSLYSYSGQRPIIFTDPNGEWFVVDDAFTGPVDEIAVVGLLAIGAYLGVPGAKEASQNLSNAISGMFSSSASPEMRLPNLSATPSAMTSETYSGLLPVSWTGS